ncbi:MAG: LuxR C-terminal-related transcriptional regulator [Xanthomonadales bacterium]|nr:LuxR C-terminal-related transcriptional regulator [Xanthomonadales bacterium]
MNSQTSNYITGDPAFAVDRQGSIVLWNNAAEEALGIECSTALGQKCWSLLCGRDVYGNRHCCEHCPIREQAFQHEPVRSFHAAFKTGVDGHEAFGINCVIISDQPDQELLLHICNPEKNTSTLSSEQLCNIQPVESLSSREVEVLTLLAEKVKTQDIADRLAISIRTVRTHIQHLMYKLHVHKRAEAIQAGKDLNLI